MSDVDNQNAINDDIELSAEYWDEDQSEEMSDSEIDEILGLENGEDEGIWDDWNDEEEESCPDEPRRKRRKKHSARQKSAPKVWEEPISETPLWSRGTQIGVQKVWDPDLAAAGEKEDHSFVRIGMLKREGVRRYAEYAEEKTGMILQMADRAFESDDTAGQGRREIKRSIPVETAKILMSGRIPERSGEKSEIAILKARAHTAAEAHERIKSIQERGEFRLNEQAFDSKESLIKVFDASGVISKCDRDFFLRHRKLIYRELTAKSVLVENLDPVTDKKLLDFVYFGATFKADLCQAEVSTYQKAVYKAFKNKGTDLSKLRLDRVSNGQLMRIVRHPGRYGLSKEDAALLHSFSGRKRIQTLNRSIRSGKKPVCVRIGKMLIARALEDDENAANGMYTISSIYMSTGYSFMGGKALIRTSIRSAGAISRVTGISYLSRKVGGEIINRIEPKLLSVGSAINKKVTKKTAPIKAFTTEKKSRVKAIIRDSKAGRSIESVKTGMKQAGTAIKTSKAADGVRKGKKAVKKTGQTVKHAAYVTAAPFRLLGSLFGFLGKIKKYIITAIGIVFVPIIILYAVVFILSMFMTSIGGLGIGLGEASALPTMVSDIWYKYILYDEYIPEMKEDMELLAELDEEVYSKCEELGEGHPVSDEVYEGHIIDHYGSPDKEKGYTITYLDAFGNELPSRSTNIKDVEALCIAMVDNSLGEYEGTKNYADDLVNFDLLLKDMYEVMVYHDPDTGEPYMYEESEIYVCVHGCDEFEYFCNDESYYSLYERYKADGCGTYEALEPYSGEGCETREVEVPADIGDGEKVTVTEYYCPGHSLPICYGHRDIDIYVTLYDVEYAIANNLMPDDLDKKPYSYMLKDFLECGGWNDNDFAAMARNYVEGDWYELYGILVEGAEFATRDELTPEEIEAIIDAYDGDITKAREDIIKYGLKWVGKIAYQWGGKASEYSDNARFGSSTPDYKGRSNGLDCSGFVAFVYGTAIGVKLPSSTAGYSGYATKPYSALKVGDLGFIAKPGAKTNHVAIYMGKNTLGQDQWLECNSSNGACVTTSTSYRVFIDPLK